MRAQGSDLRSEFMAWSASEHVRSHEKRVVSGQNRQQARNHKNTRCIKVVGLFDANKRKLWHKLIRFLVVIR